MKQTMTNSKICIYVDNKSDIYLVDGKIMVRDAHKVVLNKMLNLQLTNQFPSVQCETSDQAIEWLKKLEAEGLKVPKKVYQKLVKEKSENVW